MAKVKFNIKSYDRDTQITYPAVDDFVDVSDAFAKRIKDYQEADPKNRKDWFEFEPEKPVKSKKEEAK